MNKNHKILIGSILFIWIIILLVLFYINKSVNQIKFNWVEKKWDTMIADSQKILQDQQKILLPPEYTNCKKNLQMIDCILKTDSNQNIDNIKLLDPTEMASKMDKLQEFENNLWPNQKELMKQISFDIQDVYANRKPDIIFQDSWCKTAFCSKIMIDAKIQIVQRMHDRGLIKKQSTCNKIVEWLVKNYCLNLFFK